MTTLRQIAATSLVVGGLVAPATASASALPSPEPPRTPIGVAGVSPTQFGASLYTPDDVSRLSTLMGRPLSSVRVFLDSLPPTWSRSAVLASIPANATVSLSFRIGTPDQLQTFLSGRPAQTTCYVTYFHEPEDNFLSPTQKADYLASWRGYAPAIRAAGCTPTLILMKWTLDPSSQRNWRDYYSPGSVDLLAYDAYNAKAKAKDSGYGDPTAFLAPVLAVAKQTGLPWALAEIASDVPAGTTREDRAAWAHSVALVAAASPSFRYADWWDMLSKDGSRDYRLYSPTALAWHP